jgi:hypothetical protein
MAIPSLGAAFGGPMYYGHSANGYADTNVYLYQTQQVHEVFDALDESQRKQALAPSNPGDGEPAISSAPTASHVPVSPTPIFRTTSSSWCSE